MSTKNDLVILSPFFVVNCKSIVIKELELLSKGLNGITRIGFDVFENELFICKEFTLIINDIVTK